MSDLSDDLFEEDDTVGFLTGAGPAARIEDNRSIPSSSLSAVTLPGPSYKDGRIPASKNMRLAVIKAAHGCSVFYLLYRFCMQQKTGMVILGGSGTVSNLSLRNINYVGKFRIRSMSGTLMPTGDWEVAPCAIFVNDNGLTIGGLLQGLTAEGTVAITVAVFSDAKVVEYAE